MLIARKLNRGNSRNQLMPHTSYDLWYVGPTSTPNTSSTTFWVLEQPASGGGDTAFTSVIAAYTNCVYCAPQFPSAKSLAWAGSAQSGN